MLFVSAHAYLQCDRCSFHPDRRLKVITPEAIKHGCTHDRIWSVFKNCKCLIRKEKYADPPSKTKPTPLAPSLPAHTVSALCCALSPVPWFTSEHTVTITNTNDGQQRNYKAQVVITWNYDWFCLTFVFMSPSSFTHPFSRDNTVTSLLFFSIVFGSSLYCCPLLQLYLV